MSPPPEDNPAEDAAARLTAGDKAAFSAARAHDAALALPLAGLLLFSAPVLELFVTDIAMFGAPLIVVYLFGAWGALVVLSWALSRRLARAERRQNAGEGGA